MLAIKRNMNNVIYDHPILWGVILHSDCTTLHLRCKTDILHTVASCVKWPSWPCWDAESHLPACPPPGWRRLNQQSVQTLEGGSPSATSSPLSVHTSTRHTKQHCFTPNLSKLLLGKKCSNLKICVRRGWNLTLHGKVVRKKPEEDGSTSNYYIYLTLSQ